MREFINLSVRLLAITLIAGLLLGCTYSLTKEPIEQNRLEKDVTARREVLPDADEFAALDLNVFSEDIRPIEAFEGISNGEVVGYTFKLEATGYGGAMELTIGLDADGAVVNVSIGSNSETAGLGSKAADPLFKDQFIGKHADSSLSVTKSLSPEADEVIAITGATITSRGVTHGVNQAFECYQAIGGGSK